MDDKDELTLTLRLYDPKEKSDPAKSAIWVIVKVARPDLRLSPADFAAKYLNDAAMGVLAPHKQNG